MMLREEFMVASGGERGEFIVARGEERGERGRREEGGVKGSERLVKVGKREGVQSEERLFFASVFSACS